ncbi:Voltage-dependent calcium channel type A subunit alpha-1, partial [Frankliniella fusca]
GRAAGLGARAAALSSRRGSRSLRAITSSLAPLAGGPGPVARGRGFSSATPSRAERRSSPRRECNQPSRPRRRRAGTVTVTRLARLESPARLCACVTCPTFDETLAGRF